MYDMALYYIQSITVEVSAAYGHGYILLDKVLVSAADAETSAATP